MSLVHGSERTRSLASSKLRGRLRQGQVMDSTSSKPRVVYWTSCWRYQHQHQADVLFFLVSGSCWNSGLDPGALNATPSPLSSFLVYDIGLESEIKAENSQVSKQTWQELLKFCIDPNQRSGWSCRMAQPGQHFNHLYTTEHWHLVHWHFLWLDYTSYHQTWQPSPGLSLKTSAVFFFPNETSHEPINTSLRICLTCYW